MKKTITAIFLLSTIMVSAQNDTNGVERHQFKANLLLTPNLDYEIGVSKNSTIGFNLGTGFAWVEEAFVDETEFGVFLVFSSYYRYYYNFKRRQEKGKNTARNSANYVGVLASYLPGDPIIGDIELEDDYAFAAGPVWGFQRTYWKRLNFGLELGVGFGATENFGTIVPIGNLNLGWIIN